MSSTIWTACASICSSKSLCRSNISIVSGACVEGVTVRVAVTVTSSVEASAPAVSVVPLIASSVSDCVTIIASIMVSDRGLWVLPCIGLWDDAREDVRFLTETASEFSRPLLSIKIAAARCSRLFENADTEPKSTATRATDANFILQ